MQDQQLRSSQHHTPNKGSGSSSVAAPTQWRKTRGLLAWTRPLTSELIHQGALFQGFVVWSHHGVPCKYGWPCRPFSRTPFPSLPFLRGIAGPFSEDMRWPASFSSLTFSKVVQKLSRGSFPRPQSFKNKFGHFPKEDVWKEDRRIFLPSLGCLFQDTQPEPGAFLAV